MSRRASNIILAGMVSGAVLGVLGGYYFGDMMSQIKFLGTIFLNALKMIVVPLIIASMIVGVTSLGDIRKLGRTTGKTISYYLATTGFSVLIGIVLVNLIHPGVGVPPIGASIPEFVAHPGQKTIIDVVVGLIPDNIFRAAADGKILPLILFSLVFGGVLTIIGDKGKPVVALFEGINAAIMKIVMLIIFFAPVGIFALIGGIVAENRDSIDKLITALGLYALTVIIGLLIHAVIILPIILKVLGRRKPFRYFLNMLQALATAFTTASSSATLPVTMESVEEKNKVDRKAASFVLPLGATINMDGTALYEAVAALFIAQIYGIDLSIGAQVIIFFTAVLASIGAAAIPEAGLVMMSLVLTAVGLPLEGIGILLAIDWFLDRCRTTVNVWGDSVGAAVIGQTVEIKSYTSPTSSVRFYDSRKQTLENKKPGFEQSERPARSTKFKGRTKTTKSYDSRKKERRMADGRTRAERGSRKEQKPRIRKETGPTRGNAARKGIEEVKKQHDSVIRGGKTPEEKRRKETDKKQEGFFDIEFSKIDFFGGEVRDEDTAKGKEKRKPDIETATSSAKPSENKNEADDDTGAWGRDRKKRPYK